VAPILNTNRFRTLVMNKLIEDLRQRASDARNRYYAGGEQEAELLKASEALDLAADVIATLTRVQDERGPRALLS